MTVAFSERVGQRQAKVNPAHKEPGGYDCIIELPTRSPPLQWMRASPGGMLRAALLCTMALALPGERFLRANHTELVSFGIGQYRPGLFSGLPDVDATRPQGEKPLDLLLAVLRAAG